MVNDYNNWSVQNVEDQVGGLLSGIFKTLDRPRGAAIAALKLQNPIDGFLHPEQYQGRDVLGIDRIQNDTLRNIAGTAVDIAADPLNLVGGIASPEKLGLISHLVGSGVEGGVTKRLLSNYAIGAGARAGSDLATYGLDQTNLPGAVKTPLELGAGLAGATLAGRPFNGSGVEGIGKASNMVEEQLDQPNSNYFDYLDSLKNQPFKTVDNMGHTQGTYDTYEEALNAKNGYIQGNTSNPLMDEIASHKLPQYDIPVDTSGTTDQKFIDRQALLIPADRAPIDDVLNQSHPNYTHKFNYFLDSNPSLHSKLGDWINSSTGEAGQQIRQSFVDGTKDAVDLHAVGEEWRQQMHKISAENPTPFIQNGKVFLYRGEHNYGINNETPIFDKPYVVSSFTSDPKVTASGFSKPIEVTNPITGAKEQTNFIIGKWVPIDDVIGPLGSNGNEREFLVLDRDSVNDDVYKKLTGVSKDLTTPTTIYDVIDPTTGKHIEYKNTEAEAIQATHNPIVQDSNPIGFEYTDQSGIKRILSPKDLDGYQQSINNPYAYKIESPFSKGLPFNVSQQEYDNFYKDSDAFKATPIDPPVVKPIYGASDKLGDSASNYTNWINDFSHHPDDYTFNYTPTKTSIYADYVPAARGFTPDVEASKQVLPNNFDGVASDKYVLAKDENSPYYAVKDLGFADLASAQASQKSIGGGTIMPMDEYLSSKAPATGMFDNPTNALDKGLPTSDNPPLPPEPPNGGQPPTDNRGLSGDFQKDFNTKALVPVEGTLKNANTMSDAEIAQAQLNISPAFDSLAHDITGAGVVGYQDKVAYAPPAPIMGPEQVITATSNNPSIAGVDYENLDPVALKSAQDFYANRLGDSHPSDELVNLFVNNFKAAGKSDSTLLGHVNAMLRGLWATGDGSWMGIQGLLSIPRLALTGNFQGVYDTVVLPQLVLAGNKKAMGNFLTRTMANLPEGAPSLGESASAGLHLAFLKGNPDFEFNILDKLPFFKPEEAFMAAGDISRISTFYNEWQRFGKDVDLEGLARAVNRATGIAEKPFGGYIGSFALFAPRFFQSQLETVAKSLVDGTIEGQLARRQMLSMIGTGVALTATANYVRGYTDGDMWNPTSGNFMRVRNVAGQDISVFGPWDSLVKFAVHMGQGDFKYAETKASPIITVAINAITGKTFTGEDFHDPIVIAKSLLLPFAWQNVGKEPPLATSLGFFGFKSSPQSPSEIIDANMKNLGLDPNDPLARREFQADHPTQKTFFTDEEAKAGAVQQDIAARSYTNNLQTMNDSQSLAQFRANRVILQREQRNKLEVLLNNQDFKADTQKRQWVQSYFNLYDNARDPITNDINGPKLDQLQSDWTAKNGDAAFNYLQDYLLVGKNPVDLKYSQDMQQLRKIGYFDTPKYTPAVYQMAGGLDDNQITAYRDQVSAARFNNPALAALPFNVASRMVLGNNLSGSQIFALDNAGKKAFENPVVTKLKAQYPELLAWFNPNAHWSSIVQLNAKKNQFSIPALSNA